jgi:zinc protease
MNGITKLLCVILLLVLVLSLITADRFVPCLNAAEDQGKVIIPPAALKMYDKLQEHTLANGLRVFLLPVPGSPVVTTMMAYKVGSCDEDKTFTGLSHYLEHLMFKGTGKLMPGDIDRMTQRSGGSNNAYTTEDMTAFHFDFAADRWETALDIEADRMRGLLIDSKHEFEQEKGAVISELARNEDQPGDLEYKAIAPMLFGKNSPYGHPVIGERDHVKAATAEVIKAYYDKWYYPNNAAFIVVGGIDPASALAKIQAKFAGIPKGALPERNTWPQQYPHRPERYEFTSKFPTARMLCGFVTVPQGHADESPLDIASVVLAGGKTSRLYQELVIEKRLAVDVTAAHKSGRFPGWFSIEVELLPGKDRAQAEKIVLDALRRLSQQEVPVPELQKSQRLLLAQTLFQREGIHNLADSIVHTVLVQPASALKEQLSKWAAVTSADVQRVTKQYLRADEPVIVWSIPPAAPPGEGKNLGAGKSTQPALASSPASSPSRLARKTQGDGEPGAVGLSLKHAKQAVLPNGLTIVLMENHRLPIVVAAAALREVRLYEPAEKAGVTQLMGSLLDEGTQRRTGQQISEAIENVGGILSFGARSSSVKVLSDDKKLGLDLLFDCLLHPTFPAEAMARKKDEQLAEIADAQEQPSIRAMEAFMAGIYGNFYLGRPTHGTMQTVEKLTGNDCADIHKRVMLPENVTVAVVGDFNSDEIVAEITKLTQGWQGKLPAPPPQPELLMAPSSSTRYISMPRAAQLQLFMGHLGIKRDNRDYFKLLVMDNVLGTGAGFTDRLSARIRDRAGLAYTVSANITDTASLETGVFSCYSGIDAPNLDQVRKLFVEEIDRLRGEAPTESEVDSAKQYLLGRLAFTLTTDERIAEQLLMVQRYHLGFDYYEKYRKAVEAVTPDQVREMAATYLHPDKFTVAAAGAIDQQGKPLAAQPGK